MNHFSYDVMQKEKARELQAEGLRSQAFYRLDTRRRGLLPALSKLAISLLGVLGLLSMLLR